MELNHELLIPYSRFFPEVLISQISTGLENFILECMLIALKVQIV